MKIYIIKMIFRIRLQEAMVEQNKLCKQLENVEYELQLQKNELNMSTQEKLKVCFISRNVSKKFYDFFCIKENLLYIFIKNFDFSFTGTAALIIGKRKFKIATADN